jgi:hypothetical protein
VAETRRPQLIRQPPSTQDPAQATWQRRVTDELNKFPQFSTFSYATPESNVTAARSTIGINFASAASVLWIKQVGDDNLGWVALA